MHSSNPLDTALQALDALGIERPEGRVTLERYGDSPEMEQVLLALIKSGSKTATASLAWAYEAEGLQPPEPGDIGIVVTLHGRMEGVTRIQSVEILPFEQVSPGHAALEGEGDGSLRHWRDVHWTFFSRECARLGLSPSPRMPVVCTRFKLLHVLASGPDA